MPLANRITHLARRMLDVLLSALILFVLGIVVIAKVIPAVTGGGTFVVGGSSMEPAIPLGSVVVALPVAADQLAPGDIVSVRVGEQQALFTHRIARLVDRADGPWLETRATRTTIPIPRSSLLPASSGGSRSAIPLLGYAVRLLGTMQGILFLLALARLPARSGMAARVPRDRPGGGAAPGGRGAHGDVAGVAPARGCRGVVVGHLAAVSPAPAPRPTWTVSVSGADHRRDLDHLQAARPGRRGGQFMVSIPAPVIR